MLLPLISVCIISYNEEKKLEECLQSILPLADEIIFVDSYSTDETIKIAEKYTNKIYMQNFLGYVQQKNFAIDKAKNNWVLCLD